MITKREIQFVKRTYFRGRYANRERKREIHLEKKNKRSEMAIRNENVVSAYALQGEFNSRRIIRLITTRIRTYVKMENKSAKSEAERVC